MTTIKNPTTTKEGDNYERFIKVEIDKDFWKAETEINEGESLHRNVFEDKDELSLYSMEDKPNSQLDEYLRLAELGKSMKDRNQQTTQGRKQTPLDYEKEKTIIPLRERQQANREEREEASKCSASKRTKHQEKEVTVQQEKQKQRLKRKNELERERRAAIADLFEELDYWVKFDRNYTIQDTETKLTRFNKLPYNVRTNAAIECIKSIELGIKKKEIAMRDLQTRNEKLRSKISII